MSTKEVDLVGEAIKGTEEEIFAAGTSGSDEDLDTGTDGDRSLEEMGSDPEGRGPVAAADDEGDDGDDGVVVDETGRHHDRSNGKFIEKASKGDDEGDQQQEQAGRQPSEPQRRQEADDGRIPRTAFLGERERRQAAESELQTYRQESQREIQALNARMDQILTALTTRAAPQAEKAAPAQAEGPTGDFFENPAEHISYYVQQAVQPLQQELQTLRGTTTETRYELSMRAAALRHQDEFPQAFEAFRRLDPRNPSHMHIGRGIATSADPGEAMVDWWRGERVKAEVGSDPAAYRERIAKETREQLLADPEFRQQIIDGLRAEAGGPGNGQPRTSTRIPKSLNGARGGSHANAPDPSLYDNSDRAVFDSAWG